MELKVHKSGVVRIYNVILEILLDDYISREGLSDMPLAIAIKNALMRIRGSITEKAKADNRQI